jgi:hypothetical protein
LFATRHGNVKIIIVINSAATFYLPATLLRPNAIDPDRIVTLPAHAAS